jgi:hypothetical protein
MNITVTALCRNYLCLLTTTSLNVSWTGKKSDIIRQVTFIIVHHSLELKLHQLILRSLARNVGESQNDANLPSVETAVDLIASKVETRDLSSSEGAEECMNQRVFMVKLA